MNDEIMISWGGEIKSTGNLGRVGGYAVLFGSPEQPDQSSMRDYFTSSTDFGRHLKSGTDLLYHHDLPKIAGKANPLSGRVLGEGEFKADDVGVWIEGQLALRDEYEKKVHDELVAKGKAGWSTGTASHRVKRERQANGCHKVLTWPLGLDCSITPTPAEPRTSVVSLKSLMDEIDDEGASPSFLDNALKAVSDLERAAAGFAKLGKSKREAIKSLRDALDSLLQTDPDPREAKALYARFLQTEARLAGIMT